MRLMRARQGRIPELKGSVPQIGHLAHERRDELTDAHTFPVQGFANDDVAGTDSHAYSADLPGQRSVTHNETS